ncbi:hypothetical protein AgCh_013740 [Apium graveolens]
MFKAPFYITVIYISSHGYGYRNDLFKMLADIKPAFLIFLGGCFIEGNRLPNAVRWKDSIGPWEEGLDTTVMFGITGQMD